MKKSLLLHLFWSLIAIAAYALGSRSSQSPEQDTILQAQNSPSSLSSRSTNHSTTQNPLKKATSSTSSSAQNTPLNENEIRQLGLNLKSAKGPLARREAFSQILKNLNPENALLMREQILHLGHNSQEFREFHYAWGALAGENAVLNGLETPERDTASTFAGWASASPSAALAYFDGLSPEEKNSTRLKWGAVYGLVEADPNLAVKFALDQQEAGDPESRRLIDLIARQVLRSGEPAEAAAWASSIPAGEMQDTAISRIAQQYADEDPIATLEWAHTLPPSDGKNRALRASFSEWAQENPTAAADRLSSMSDSPERDFAAYGFATRVAQDDPQAGIEWAGTIRDEATRTNALMETGRTFFRQDPEAAREWLQNSGLNEEQQQRVTTRRRGRRG